jgi:hypothetical protein
LGLRYTLSPFLSPRLSGSRQTTRKYPRPAKVESAASEQEPRPDGRGFFRWWIFCPSPTSSPPPRIFKYSVMPPSRAVGAYRYRRGPNGPRGHDGAPWGGRASGDRAGPWCFQRSQAPQSRHGRRVGLGQLRRSRSRSPEYGAATRRRGVSHRDREVLPRGSAPDRAPGRWRYRWACIRVGEPAWILLRHCVMKPRRLAV